MLLKFFAKAVLKLAGWKIVGELPAPKAVVMMAPHTANLDFFMGWLGYTSMGIKSHFLIKKEIFKWYTSGILKAMGGIPVDRKRSSNVVLQITEEFHKRKKFIVTITPEGTRKLNKHWKRGFYYIAQSAGVPVSMGFLDYKKKEGGFGESIYPSGNFEEDLKIMEDFYSSKTAKHPERFNLSPENR